jgi:DNA-directed RNA polymerase I, II, and III subunit RPABC2
MSDDEYYSETEDNLSDTNSDEGEIISVPPKTTFKPPKISKEEDSDQDDAENSDDEEYDEEDIPDDEEEDILVESDDDVDEEDEDEEEENVVVESNTKKKSEKKTGKKQLMIIDDDEDEDPEEYNDNYLEKFDSELVKSYIDEFHPECLSHNYDEIAKLSVVVRNSDGIIIDPLHRTIPYLTKYEKARILGQRAKQIETGSTPFVKVPENIVDGHIIADLELKEKKIPFIIKRPIPSGGCEYWNLKDLEVIAF